MQIIAEAENSGNIYISTIVLMEIYDLSFGKNQGNTINM